MAPLETRVRRVYEQDDGVRVLVDRVWPRGLSKDAAKLDEWMKDIAPSSELRKWFGHDPEKFARFCRLYREELDTPDGRRAVERLRSLTDGKPLTLLTATKDLAYSHAIVLEELLRE